jgi:hypothetical protein
MKLNKNSLIILSILLTVITALSLSACFSQWQGDTAELIISVSGANRTAGEVVYNPVKAPNEPLDHEVTLTRGKETLTFTFKAGTPIEITLAPGNWNVQVDSYLKDEIYATGSKPVVLKLGQNFETIDMYQAFMITFDANGGSGKKRPLIVKAGDYAVLPDGSGFSKSGYDFVSWNTDREGNGTKYFAGDTYKTDKESTGITLFAKWEVENALPIITFINNKGDVGVDGNPFDNWVAYYDIPPSVRGDKINAGDVYIFTYSFKSNVVINSYLHIEIIDESNGWHGLADWNDLFLIPMSDIPADTIVSGTIIFTANKTALSSAAYANRLAFLIDPATAAEGKPTFTFTEFSFVKAKPAQGGNLKDKLEWIRNSNPQNNTAYIATVTAPESLGPQELYYSGNKVIIILKGDTTDRNVNLSGNGSMFTINSGVTLILDNYITLQGHDFNNDSLVKVYPGGTLEMNAGSKITGNTNNSGNDGGGVGIGWDGGTFNMKGGTISDNVVLADGCGGGVCVSGSGSIFTMSGGTISGNKAPTWGGGGVRVTFGTFIMNGGLITGNTAQWAGAIDFYA